MSEWAIRTLGLTKEFDGKRVVSEVDLSVPEGSVFGLMGPNGAGKSTLIRLLMGIVKPTQGSGTIFGNDITDPSGLVRAQVGYVADVQQMYPLMQVRDVIDLCARLYPNWDAKRADNLRKALDVAPNQWVRTLSKGMKTQLALLIALSIRPRLLILDEPTSGLDTVMKQNLMQLILQEAATGDTTVFYSTHHLHDLERMSDQVAVMMEGRLLLNRSLEELKRSAGKIQTVFPAGLPEEIANHPDVLRVMEQGKVYTIIVQNNYPQVFEKIRLLQPFYLETVDMSLEEVFLHTVAKEGYAHEPVSFA